MFVSVAQALSPAIRFCSFICILDFEEETLKRSRRFGQRVAIWIFEERRSQTQTTLKGLTAT